jgi:hypothetical protein
MTRTLGMNKRSEHWTKSIFRQNLIPLTAISRRLDMSYEYVSAVLSGSVAASDDVYEKLEEFAYEVLRSIKADQRDRR